MHSRAAKNQPTKNGHAPSPYWHAMLAALGDCILDMSRHVECSFSRLAGLTEHGIGVDWNSHTTSQWHCTMVDYDVRPAHVGCWLILYHAVGFNPELMDAGTVGQQLAGTSTGDLPLDQ